ncbi:MAG TPA: NUDIX domain-containing protein [Candidatus Eisenbacteria bacterium]
MTKPRAARGPAFPCARCGRPLRRAAAGRRIPRTLRCERCRYLMYDYPRPCAGVVVVKGGEVLVLRRAHRPRRGFLDIPGGFMDAGESIEDAARRELREETGLTVGALEWLGFYWDRYYLRGFGYFPTMNFYYLARWRSGAPHAADDAASAQWVPAGKLGGPGQRLAWTHMRQVFREVRRRLRRRRAA